MKRGRARREALPSLEAMGLEKLCAINQAYGDGVLRGLFGGVATVEDMLLACGVNAARSCHFAGLCDGRALKGVPDHCDP